jgi:DNA-binding NarL/FixJ family response regulator
MKILLADDHAMFREGVSHILQALDEEVIIIQSGNVEQALQAAAQHDDLDLALIDLYMPGKNGFDALEVLSSQQPTLPIVVLSASNNQQDMQRAVQLGAMGYIRKDSSGSVMLNALRLVMAGEVFIPSQLMPSSEQQATHLTQRQQDVLLLMEQGLANKLIADRLNISEATVKMHISAIFRELGVTNRTQAVLKAREMQILHSQ